MINISQHDCIRRIFHLKTNGRKKLSKVNAYIHICFLQSMFTAIGSKEVLRREEQTSYGHYLSNFILIFQ